MPINYADIGKFLIFFLASGRGFSSLDKWSLLTCKTLSAHVVIRDLTIRQRQRQ